MAIPIETMPPFDTQKWKEYGSMQQISRLRGLAKKLPIVDLWSGAADTVHTISNQVIFRRSSSVLLPPEICLSGVCISFLVPLASF